jgi:hypothetical protein
VCVLYTYDVEMAGIADASGVDYQKLLRVHMIGELTKVRASVATCD